MKNRIPFKLKPLQRTDLARAAILPGWINGWDTGLGKTIAMFLWPLLKLGFLLNPLRPKQAVLLIVPGDGHAQTEDESRKHFKTAAVRLDCQATFLKLSKPDARTGVRVLPPHYYITSYTKLTQNGVAQFPKLNRNNIDETMALLWLTQKDVDDWFNRRGTIYRRHYELLEATTETDWPTIEATHTKMRRNNEDEAFLRVLSDAYHTLRMITPINGRLSAEQKTFLKTDMTVSKHFQFGEGIAEARTLEVHAAGEEPTEENRIGHIKIKCVYDPTLADLCQDSFGAVCVDEGTKIKGEETLIGTGCRQINAPHRMVMTATPIKNRFPDVFHLAHYVCGGHDEPTARFPYGKKGFEDFSNEFLQTERNVTKEADGKRSFKKKTPRVCNVHRAWKLFAPIILRRRKADFGEDIVPKIRHVVRVPMGLSQAAVYQYHLKAKYRDYRGKPAPGAKLQALRVAAANPASLLLERPASDTTKGMVRSPYDYIPKVASGLQLIQQVLERGEQVVVFSAFQNSLDAMSARLREAGVKHLVMDGRISQAKRGQLAKQFKAGGPRALKAGLTDRISEYPVMLAGIDCMAELHSFNLCNNVILLSYSWALDKFEQGIGRVHRLNSPWEVHVWSVICEGSVDRKLESNISEKGDAAELVLDGHLLGEDPSEVNLYDLLQIAQKEFKDVKVMDEEVLIEAWPKLRSELSRAYTGWASNAPRIGVFSELNPREIVPATMTDLNTLPLWRMRLLKKR